MTTPRSYDFRLINFSTRVEHFLHVKARKSFGTTAASGTESVAVESAAASAPSAADEESRESISEEKWRTKPEGRRWEEEKERGWQDRGEDEEEERECAAQK